MGGGLFDPTLGRSRVKTPQKAQKKITALSLIFSRQIAGNHHTLADKVRQDFWKPYTSRCFVDPL